jgi:hypothetical protein
MVRPYAYRADGGQLFSGRTKGNRAKGFFPLPGHPQMFRSLKLRNYFKHGAITARTAMFGGAVEIAV